MSPVAPTSIILASQSPRRQALLRQIGLDHRVVPARGEERLDPSLPPHVLVQHLSREKAREVAVVCEPDALVIAADTVVALDGVLLGKPKNAADAGRMLRLLSGKTHRVDTGLCLLRGSRCVTDVVSAAVTFRPLSGKEIDAYLQTGEPMDKAGAYGIQGKGALLVSGISGDYYAVMGLPLCRLAELLPEFGVSPWQMDAKPPAAAPSESQSTLRQKEAAT